MYSGLLAAILLTATILFFVVYKRSMLVRLFSLDMKNQVDTFESNIQNTANLAVTKLTDASDDLAELLADAHETIEELKLRTKIAEEQLYKLSINELKRNGENNTVNNSLQTPLFKAKESTFKEQLIKATYKTTPHLDDDAPLVARPANKLIKEQKIPDEKAHITSEKVSAKTYLETENYSDGEKEFPVIDMRDAEPKFKQKQILKLAANGYDDKYIAKTLKLGISEVKLTRKLVEH